MRVVLWDVAGAVRVILGEAVVAVVVRVVLGEGVVARIKVRASVSFRSSQGTSLTRSRSGQRVVRDQRWTNTHRSSCHWIAHGYIATCIIHADRVWLKTSDVVQLTLSQIRTGDHRIGTQSTACHGHQWTFTIDVG